MPPPFLLPRSFANCRLFSILKRFYPDYYTSMWSFYYHFKWRRSLGWILGIWTMSFHILVWKMSVTSSPNRAEGSHSLLCIKDMGESKYWIFISLLPHFLVCTMFELFESIQKWIFDTVFWLFKQLCSGRGLVGISPLSALTSILWAQVSVQSR